MTQPFLTGARLRISKINTFNVLDDAISMYSFLIVATIQKSNRRERIVERFGTFVERKKGCER